MKHYVEQNFTEFNLPFSPGEDEVVRGCKFTRCHFTWCQYITFIDCEFEDCRGRFLDNTPDEDAVRDLAKFALKIGWGIHDAVEIILGRRS